MIFFFMIKIFYSKYYDDFFSHLLILSNFWEHWRERDVTNIIKNFFYHPKSFQKLLMN